MSSPSHDDIAAILAAREFDKFLGLDENLFFEAKRSSPYDLEVASGRIELAKDVASFANAEGGYIVVGLDIEKLLQSNVDRVTKLDLMPATAFPTSKILGVIGTHVYPKLSNLAVEWVASRDKPELGVGVITIPAQPEDRKWFLLTNVSIEGESQKQIIVGLSRRAGGDSLPLTVEQVYQAINRGRTSAAMRAERIEAKVDALLSRSGGAVLDPTSILPGRIERIADDS